MPQAEVTLHARPPGAHKSIVQSAANYRAGQGNQTADPLFRRFLSELHGQPFCDAWGESLKNLLFGKILAVINARSCGSSHPQLQPFTLATLLESVKQAKSLDEA
jgi:hypothetical protein